MAFDYFTLAELRAKPDMTDEERYPSSVCEAAAEYIVGVFEREVGTSFVARVVTDEVHDGYEWPLQLDQPYVLSVLSVTQGTVTTAGSSFTAEDGMLRYASLAQPRWTAGFGNVRVTYEAGYCRTPPPDVKEMALKATRAYLIENHTDAGTNDRRTTLSTEMGTMNFTVADEDHPTGYPMVDACIIGWKRKLDVGGFA